MTYGKRTLIAVDQLLTQYAPRRLAGRNPVLALLPLGAGRGEGMAPARGGRAVLLAEGTLQKQL